MGLSNKKSTSTQKTSQTETATTTRTNPQWVTDAMQGYTSRVAGLLDDKASDYVAPVNPLQEQAGKAASGLGGWQDILKGATGSTSSVAGSSLLDGLASYMDPYRDQVVNATLADADADAGRTRSALAASGARNGAFGGSRFGVREAQTEGELSRARTSAEAALLSEMFNTGANLSDRDAGRRQEAALANQRAEMADRDRRLNAAALAGSNSRDDAALQMGIGTALRGIDTEQRGAELGLMGAIGDLLAKGQYGLFGGTNSTGTMEGTTNSTATEKGGLLSGLTQAVQLAAAGASFFSDRRLKTDLRPVGSDPRGRRWWSYRYLWDGPEDARHVGVIAQDVARTDPDAVSIGPLGFLMVDYSKLEGATCQAS